eukprot:COSAG01_NODE_4185_length_5261_cov_2.430260_9_plen_70_part_00
MKIAFQGTMATAQTGPRELSSRLLGKLVRVDGILTKCGTNATTTPPPARSLPSTRAASLYAHQGLGGTG